MANNNKNSVENMLQVVLQQQNALIKQLIQLNAKKREKRKHKKNKSTIESQTSSDSDDGSKDDLMDIILQNKELMHVTKHESESTHYKNLNANINDNIAVDVSNFDIFDDDNTEAETAKKIQYIVNSFKF